MLTEQPAIGAVTAEPLVTIAIPTFNRASWLKKCISAALSQTYRNFEVLVSDNASTDDTAEVLRQFDDTRLRVVRQPTNIGILSNWNACLAGARGDYIVYCSDDDLLAPAILERCLAIARRNPQVPIVLGLCDFYFLEDSHCSVATPSTRFSTGLCEGVPLLIEFLRNRITLGNCAMMFRTQPLRADGGLPLELAANGADVAAWARLLMRGKVGFVNESCATYCVHNATETASHSIEACLQGEKKLTDYLVRMAGVIVQDARRRRQLQAEAKLFLAGRAVYALAQYRKRGDKFTDVVPWVWRWRREIGYLRFGNPAKFIKPIALIFVPAPIANQIRHFKRVYSRLTARMLKRLDLGEER
jgi:GT2 family glycosyltransferase